MGPAEFRGLYHSTGGAFQFQLPLAAVKALHVAGSTVVVVQYREIRWCTANVHHQCGLLVARYGARRLYGETACGKDASTFVVVASGS